MAPVWLPLLLLHVGLQFVACHLPQQEDKKIFREASGVGKQQTLPQVVFALETKQEEVWNQQYDGICDSNRVLTQDPHLQTGLALLWLISHINCCPHRLSSSWINSPSPNTPIFLFTCLHRSSPVLQQKTTLYSLVYKFSVPLLYFILFNWLHLQTWAIW